MYGLRWEQRGGLGGCGLWMRPALRRVWGSVCGAGVRW